jgi:hypothetical protein
MNLYWVNVDDESKLIGVFTQDDIKKRLGGTIMLPQKFFKSEYFPEEPSLVMFISSSQSPLHW